MTRILFLRIVFFLVIRHQKASLLYCMAVYSLSLADFETFQTSLLANVPRNAHKKTKTVMSVKLNSLL